MTSIEKLGNAENNGKKHRLNFGSYSQPNSCLLLFLAKLRLRLHSKKMLNFEFNSIPAAVFDHLRI